MYYKFLLVILLYSNSSFSQFQLPKISFGILFSDIDLPQTLEKSEQQADLSYNSRKQSWQIGGEVSYGLSKYFKLDLGINYQERKPLELFIFDLVTPTSVVGTGVIYDYPTSSQSSKWPNSNEPAIQIFQNFKYINFDIIPIFSIGKKIYCYAGIGLYYSYLLNHKKLNFKPSDFTLLSGFFTDSSEIKFSGIEQYRSSDFGGVAKLGCLFYLNKHFSFGFSSHYYVSSYSLKKERDIYFPNTTTNFSRKHRTTWVVSNFNLDVSWKFK